MSDRRGLNCGFGSEYQESLPLAFVFGIATSVAAVHQLLPRQVSSLLATENFKLQDSMHRLTLLLEEVSCCAVWIGQSPLCVCVRARLQILVSEGIPIRFGHKVYRFLIENFIMNSFSTAAFMRAVQVAYCLVGSVLCDAMW